MNVSFSLTLLSLALLYQSTANAEETVPQDDLFFQSLPIVLTASRLSQPVSEAPSAMTVINREMIDASGFRSVPELMRLVPGMYVGFADANRPVVSFHGSADEYAHRMQILIDGRSVYMPPFGNVGWADLPLMVEDIDRIEVVRGPASASHGTNSFYGVINIITRDAMSQNGGSVSATGGYASDFSVRYGKVSEQVDFRLSAGYRSDAGLNNNVYNDHNATKLVNFRASFHPSEQDNLELQLGGSDGLYGMGIRDRVGEVRRDSVFRDTTSQSQFELLTWLHNWSDNDESKLTYSNTFRSAQDPKLCVNTGLCDQLNPLGFAVSNVISQRNELGLQNTHAFGENNRLVWGGNVRRDYANASLLFTQSYTVNPWQIFAHDEWHISSAAVLNIGGMLENNGMNSQDFSPRASLSYHFTPQQTVRVGISTATRSPAMFEAYVSANNTYFGGAYVPPLESLRPEHVISREIAYLGEFPSLGMTLDSRAYVDEVNDLIWWDKFVDPTNSSYPDSYKNLLAAEYRGWETTVKYRWDEGRSFLSANFVLQSASARLSGTPTQYNNPNVIANFDPTQAYGAVVRAYYQDQYLNQFSQSVPAQSGSLLWSQHLGNQWKISLGYYFRGLVRVGDVSNDVTPEYRMRRIDVRIAKRLNESVRNNAEVALVIQNLTQDQYTNYGTLNEKAAPYFTQRAWLTTTIDF